MVDIKDIQGNILLSTPISEGSKRKFTLQKEDYIALKFSVDDPIYFKLGDGIDDDNIGLFELVNLYKPTYNESTGGYDYELQLDAYYWKWKNKIFKFTPESGGQEAAWNLTAGLDVHLGIFLRNLKSLSYTYRGMAFEFSIDSTVENSSKLVSYDSTNMIDALTKMAETWECEWWITDNIIHFGRCEFGDPVDFEIDVNVKSMPRSDSQTNYATRIYAFGSTRNIPTNYRPVDENIVVNGVVQKRLMLPVGTPYIDAYEDMSEEEAVEDIVIFDDIYPRRIGTASAITTKEYTDTIENEDGTKKPEKWNAYRFKDSGITFSKDYIITGQELRIKFESGLLNGMEFGVTFNPEGTAEKLSNGLWNPKAQLWEIVRNDDYGRNLPDETLKPVTGDTYVLSGFDTSLVSDQYLPAAEQELKEKAQAYVEKTKKDPSTYSCTMSSVYMHNDGESRIFEIGDRVNLINKGYFENGRMSRIIGFEYYLDKPWDSTIYTVGETAAYSRIGEIEDKIDSVTYKGQTYTGGSGSGVYVIRTNDNTIASNSNVLSALRSLSTFLRKDSDDTAAGLITFLKGINVGQFTTGMLGSGGAITVDPATGKTRIEADELLVRMKAYFYELMIEKFSHVGGQIVLTPAGITCIKVEELPNAYRCYFKSSDGEKTISNDFVIGDQATIREFNIKSTVQDGTNRYYWRLITGIGDDYIDLSKTDCDTNSDVPLAGDEIVQLGNRVDHSRQSAIMLSAFGTDSPSIKQYTGIDAYSLVDKEVTVVSPHGNRFVGDFILSTGTNIATQMKVLENLIKTEIQSIEHWINDEENFLKNASFSLNMDGWESESALKVFTVEEPLVVNGEYYADAAKIAEVVSHENKYMLRLKDSFVKQLNSDLNHPDEASTFYISFRYLCEATGSLTCGFEGQELYQTVILNPNRQARIFEYSGTWDGTGDFILQFTGDIYISLVTLTNRPLDDFKKEVTSKFEQTATSLRAVVESIDNIDQTIKESGWLTEKDGTKIWASCTFSDGTKAMSLFNVTPEGIFMDGSHINLKGLVTFESFSTDFQTAYQQAFGNASMTAKDDVARQLGYTNYAQLVANAATSGKAIMVGGYLNLNLIDVETLLAGKVISAKVVTALSGKRIEIDPQKNAIMVYDGQNREIAKIYFIEHENGQSSAGVSLAQLNAVGKYEYYTSIVPGGVTIDRGYIINPASDNWERLELSPGGITFMKNGVVTKIISGQ